MPRHSTPIRRDHVKLRLQAKGWTQSAAAEELGVRFEHVNRVLNGHRESRSLLRRLEELPAREEAGA